MRVLLLFLLLLLLLLSLLLLSLLLLLPYVNRWSSLVIVGVLSGPSLWSSCSHHFFAAFSPRFRIVFTAFPPSWHDRFSSTAIAVVGVVAEVLQSFFI